MHLDSCLVELALNKDKLASLPQKARKISLWKMERVVRGKGPCSAYYLFLSLKDIFFNASSLSPFINAVGPKLTCSLGGVRSPELINDDLVGDIQLRTSIQDSVSLLLCQSWQLEGSQPITPEA